MKFLVLTALLAAVATGSLNNDNLENQTEWPWQVGKLYRYHVRSQNLVRLPEGASSGNAFRATFTIRATSPGLLQARLLNPQNAQIHQQLDNRDWKSLPEDLKYEPVKNLDMPFEIKIEGGRVMSMNVPSTLSLSNQNLLKGLISTLQVDLSTYRTEHSPQNNYDQESYQGQFRKMETDVTGDCDTLYTISPTDSEWRRTLPGMSLAEDPIMITKSRNYGHCHHRVGYHFGVHELAEWTGTANKFQKEQFIDRASTSRILAGKQGPIYKAETTNTIYVHPYVYGQQKAEVRSYVNMTLEAFEQDNEAVWQVTKGKVVQSLLYSMSAKQMPNHDRSDETYLPEEVQVVDKENRLRRSVNMPRKLVSINKVIMERKRYDDTEDSSSSDSTSAYVNDEDLNSNEPAYAALYMNPQAHKVYKDNSKNALKLTQELAQLLQNNNNMLKTDFLSKFNILVRVIASMDTEQLTQTTKTVFETKPSNNLVKIDMQRIYQDAVVQAGTLPAFKQIVTWIQNEQIVGEEAAELVGSLANTLRYPTKNTMMEFFELAMSPVVTRQMFLNSTALIAATKFINMGQVDNKTAHHYYPTHMYGRLARQHDNFVNDDILPRLRQALEQAIQQQENSKAQVYIKALGNLGHRSILEVYAPYLEGKISVSTYLRALMVDSLNVLAHEKDSYTRAVLYSILRNPAEPYEVRLAAIQNIFVAHPTTSMMQAMAQMTHDDRSIHVRAAIKSAIETAAQQKNPRHLDLARTAQAARPMLTKENFGQQFSFKRYTEYFDNEYELGIMGDLSTIGSKDSMFPKYLRYSRRSQANGWDSISASVSSVQRLVEMIKQQISGKVQDEIPQEPSNQKYSAQKIAEMLNFKREPQTPLEAALYVGLWNQQRYFTVQDLTAMVNEFRQLQKIHYTKVFNQAQISVMFPLASGMPFIYRYKEPTVLHIQSKFNGQINWPLPEKMNMEAEIQFTFARNIDGNVGFMDTLTNRIASVGVVNKVQLVVPVQINLEKNKNEVKMHLQTLNPEQDSLIAHYSVWPYSTIQKKDSLVPISLDPATKLIVRSKKVISLNENERFAAFKLSGYSYSSDYKYLPGMFQSPNLLKNIIMAAYQRDVASTHFTLTYVGTTSQRSGIALTAAYDSFKNMNENSQQPLEAVAQEDLSPNSHARRVEMSKRVASGINNAHAQVIDLSLRTNTGVFLLTAAMANSPVDPKIQYAFFVGQGLVGSNSRPYVQLNSVAKVTKPDFVPLNAQQALEKEHNMNFEIDIKYGRDNRANIQIIGETKRTKEFAAALKNQHWAKICKEQMKQNNYYQEACYRAILMAQVPDYLNVTVNFVGVSDSEKDSVRSLYRSLDSLPPQGKWSSDLNVNYPIKDGVIEMQVSLDQILNVDIESIYQYKENIPIYEKILISASRALSTYQPIKPLEHVANYFTGHQYQPYCAVDGNLIKTFSRRSYNYVLSPTWHVVIQDAPREHPGQDELVVLARTTPEQQKEVFIHYVSETGHHLEIELKPTSSKPQVNVKTSVKMIAESNDYKLYWDEAEDKPFMFYYIRPDGVVTLAIRETRLRILYDSQRLVVFNSYGRNNIRGLCGRMNGEIRDDYWTPNGLVDSDVHYGASFALKEDIDEKTQQLQVEAQKMAYARTYKYTNILKSDSHWQKWQNAESTEDSKDLSSEAVYRTRSHLKQPRGTCVLSKQVQYYETSSQICITTTPLDACSSHCKGEGYKVRAAQVVCRAKTDEEFREYVKQINKGQNPQVNGVPQIRQYKVPTTCNV